MKYFLRSIKYFFSITVIAVVFLGVLVAIGAVEANIETMFRSGYDALWQMALLFAVISAVYPKVGYITRQSYFSASWEAGRTAIIEYMYQRGFVLAREEGEKMFFHQKNRFSRLMKLYEDEITISLTASGADVEGPRKDVIRFAVGIESLFSMLGD